MQYLPFSITVRGLPESPWRVPKSELRSPVTHVCQELHFRRIILCVHCIAFTYSVTLKKDFWQVLIEMTFTSTFIKFSDNPPDSVLPHPVTIAVSFSNFWTRLAAKQTGLTLLVKFTGFVKVST